MHTRTLLCRASLIAAATAGLYAMPAFAQETAGQTAADEDDGAIIVTARRREETLTNVPIAITAISGEELANRGAIDITAIAEQAPNVTLEASRGTNSTLSAFIRGVGQQDPVSGFEQGVGIYLDDVYLNRPQAAVLDIYDVERIEVLRGPQGTLYGRNTIGGAVKYVTKRLGDVAHLSLRGTYGSYNQADGVITASTPIGDGTVRIGGSLARLTRNGFGTNLTTNDENYNKNIWAGRGTIELHAADFFARVSGDYSRDTSNARGGHRLMIGAQSGAPILPNVFDTRGGLTSPKQDVEAWGATLFMEGHPTDSLTVRSITSYRKDDSSSPIDFDALPATDVDVPAFYKNTQLSQEVQVLYDSGPVHGLAGFYYLDATALTQFDVRLFTTLNGLTAYTNADVRTETMAGFANFTFDLNDQFSVELGGRYTWDQRKARILRQNYLGGGSTTFGGTGAPFGGPSTNFRGTNAFKKFTPKASLAWKPNSDNTLYASYSQGFKGGGFDPRGVGTNAPDVNGNGTREDSEIAAYLSFRPEKVNSYEVGYKTRLFDRKLSLNLAAFHADYTDVQIPGSVACTVAGLPSFCGVVSNAGKARMRGVEAEARLRTGGLTLQGSLGYIDAKFRQYITNIASKPTDVAAYRKIQNTPAWTGNVSADYGVDLGEGSLNFGAGLSWKSKTYQFETPSDYLDQPAYALVDASLVYHAPDKRWSIGVFGKNLTDKRYKTSGYIFIAGNAVTGVPVLTPGGQPIPTLGKEGVLTAYYGNPRQVYLTATLNF
ncbi:TonB-dependent receptor [Novosphingobium sp.]|uniref:TonB-dependent receptor n=1 Tax=Novosphingobium sp. TaxID=1874826 RepID=UPI0025F2801E|nr:TonB-dependent receptor [Novosphingobium sp.]